MARQERRFVICLRRFKDDRRQINKPDTDKQANRQSENKFSASRNAPIARRERFKQGLRQGLGWINLRLMSIDVRRPVANSVEQCNRQSIILNSVRFQYQT